MLIARPGRMGPLNLRNRIIMGPMGTNFGTTDGFSTERDKLYYGERARGGAAMIITEAMVITAGARNHTNSMCLFHDRYIPGLAGIVDAIHDGGALAVGQINHRGALLKRHCEAKLREASEKVAKIVIHADGSVGAVPANLD